MEMETGLNARPSTSGNGTTSGSVSVRWLKHAGGGFFETYSFPVGTTMKQAFQIVSPELDPTAYKIKVNKSPVAGDYEMRENDLVVCSPVELKGN